MDLHLRTYSAPEEGVFEVILVPGASLRTSANLTTGDADGTGSHVGPVGRSFVVDDRC